MRTAEPYTPFRKRLDAFIRGARRVDQGDVEALHQTRVASRRLRELLPLMGLEDAATRQLGRGLRRVTKRLGTVRELDVLTLLIEELDRDKRYSSAALRMMRTAVADARTNARERLATRLPPEKMERLAARLRRAVKCLESNKQKRDRRAKSIQAWKWALEARVTRRAGCARSAIEMASVVYLPERLHDVRIALKKLRYAVELLAEARDQRAVADIATLKIAQDLLGRLHDLDVLIAWTRDLQASSSPPDLTAWRQLGSLGKRT